MKFTSTLWWCLVVFGILVSGFPGTSSMWMFAIVPSLLERQCFFQYYKFCCNIKFLYKRDYSTSKILDFLLSKLEDLSLNPKHINQTLGMTTCMHVGPSLVGMWWRKGDMKLPEICCLSAYPEVQWATPFQGNKKGNDEADANNLCWPFTHIHKHEHLYTHFQSTYSFSLTCILVFSSRESKCMCSDYSIKYN